MKLTKKTIFIFLFAIVLNINSKSQEAQIGNQHLLDSISKQISGLGKTVDLSVNNLPIQELIRSIAMSNKINIVVDPSLKILVTNNFVDVSAKDVFSYLCDTYSLELKLNGKIITFKKIDLLPNAFTRKKLNISIDSVTNLISMNLSNDSLIRVCEYITKNSNRNILVMPESRGVFVSALVKNTSIDKALELLAYTNNLKIENEANSLIFRENTGANINTQNKKRKQGILKVVVKPDNLFNISAYDVSLFDLLNEVSTKANKEYFIYSDISGNAFVYLENATYEEFLEAIFSSSKYTFKKEENDIYLIGERQSESLRDTKLYKLSYRSVKDVLDAIPKALTENITIHEFVELNSLVLSGSKPAIEEVIRFLKKIDKTVPLITIDVILIDNRSGFSVSTGIDAGIAEEPVKTSGQVYPGIDMTLGAESINKLINSFNGFGALNLGNVTPNFYVSLKLMEEQGIIKVRSTPKLSTLNGHEANIIIGEKEYYVQENTDFIVNQSTSQKTTKQYKDVTAEFSLKITPYVSGDEQITLEVAVKQSTFTNRISPDAPPGQLTRDFSSLVRVKNNEMILLGGLEELRLDETSKGIPWLSRIPVLKWIFSSRDKSNADNKLNIFIKPTVIF